jgi:hypothetical protein
MTLSTDIYILDPIPDPEDLWRWVNINLLKKDAQEVRTTRREGQIHNAPMQGLDAWFMLDWSEAPQRYDDDVDDSWDEEDAEWYRGKQEKIGSPYYGRINFDTSYGFNRDGMGCTELHALYIVRLYREYFEPRGINIAWQDEYRGDVWRNLSEEGMVKFLGAGDSAMEWFTDLVKPSLEKVAKETGYEIEW